jgi:hypothetical protein
VEKVVGGVNWDGFHRAGTVRNTVVVKMILAHGLVIEAQKPASEAKTFVERIAEDGYLDPLTGQFRPLQSILLVEVARPEQSGKPWFSEN